MASSTEALRVYGSSEAGARPVLGSATVSTDRAGQQVLSIRLVAAPLDGRLEIALRDVLVLADQTGGAAC